MRVLKSNSILEIIQYNVDTENMTVYTKHVILPNNKDKCRGKSEIKFIKNPFKSMKILSITDV